MVHIKTNRHHVFASFMGFFLASWVIAAFSILPSNGRRSPSLLAVVFAFFGFQAVGCVFLGSRCDVLGRKRALLYALALLVVGLIGSLLSTVELSTSPTIQTAAIGDSIGDIRAEIASPVWSRIREQHDSAADDLSYGGLPPVLVMASSPNSLHDLLADDIGTFSQIDETYAPQVKANQPPAFPLSSVPLQASLPSHQRQAIPRSHTHIASAFTPSADPPSHNSLASSEASVSLLPPGRRILGADVEISLKPPPKNPSVIPSTTSFFDPSRAFTDSLTAQNSLGVIELSPKTSKHGVAHPTLAPESSMSTKSLLKEGMSHLSHMPEIPLVGTGRHLGLMASLLFVGVATGGLYPVVGTYLSESVVAANRSAYVAGLLCVQAIGHLLLRIMLIGLFAHYPDRSLGYFWQISMGVCAILAVVTIVYVYLYCKETEAFEFYYRQGRVDGNRRRSSGVHARDLGHPLLAPEHCSLLPPRRGNAVVPGTPSVNEALQTAPNSDYPPNSNSINRSAPGSPTLNPEGFYGHHSEGSLAMSAHSTGTRMPTPSSTPQLSGISPSPSSVSSLYRIPLKAYSKIVKSYAKHAHRSIIGTCLPWALFDFFYYGAGVSHYLLVQKVRGFESDREENLSATMVLLVCSVGYFAGVRLVPKHPAKLLQILGFVVLSFVFFGLSLCLYSIGHSPKSHPPISDYLGASLLYDCFFRFFLFLPNLTTFILPLDVFHTKVKGVFVGLAAASGRVGAMTGMLVSWLLFEPILGKSASLLFASLTALAGAVLTRAFTPLLKQNNADLLYLDVGYTGFLLPHGDQRRKGAHGSERLHSTRATDAGFHSGYKALQHRETRAQSSVERSTPD